MVSIHHLLVFVRDMNRSLLLFRDILGFNLVWRKEKVGGRKFSAFMGIPDTVIELIYLQRPKDGAGIELARMIRPPLEELTGGIAIIGIAGVCLAVNNLDDIHNPLTKEGWKPFTPCVEITPPEGDPFRGFSVRMRECI